MLVTEIIKRVRAKAQDNNEIKYSDYDILVALNTANKIYRDVCRTEAPGFLLTKLKGTLPKGENTVYFTTAPQITDDTDDDAEPTYKPNYFNYRPVRIVDIRCDGRIMHSMSFNELSEEPTEGQPTKYMISNEDRVLTLEFYPIPAKDVSVELRIVDETKELAQTDELPLPSDFANYIIDFVVASLAGASDVGAFKDGLRHAFQDFLPSICVVDSYY